MFKQRWFIAMAFVVILSIALFTVTTLLQGHKPAPTITHAGCTASPPSSTNQGSPSSANTCHRKLLVFSKTGAFRHASIPVAIAALKKLAADNNVAADFTEDSTGFNDVSLSQYDAVVFLMTTGAILNDSQQAAFERYIRSGGGYVGVHSASDTEYNWAWYGGLVGAYFDRVHGHSSVVQATIDVIDRTHPSTAMLPVYWIRTDEWYNFATNPSGHVHVLMTIDETTYKGGVMGPNHPIAWYHDYDGGRAWYSALGHTSESYSEPLFLAHLWGGITYAMGPKPRGPGQAQGPHPSTQLLPVPTFPGGPTPHAKVNTPLALVFGENQKSQFGEQDTAISSDESTDKLQSDSSICRSGEWSFVATTEGRNVSPAYLAKGASDSCCLCC